jgi:hypothetical protein
VSTEVFADAVMKAKPIAMRRCQWLAMEATSESPTPDLATRFALRAVSNYVHFGKCYGSKKIKSLNTLISIGALKKLEELKFDFDQWHKTTENEHPTPLNDIWLEHCKRAKGVNDLDSLAEWLYDELARCKMVTVLVDEHKKASKVKGDRQARYIDTGIGAPIELSSSPISMCKK